MTTLPVYRGLLMTEYFLAEGILASAPWKALDESAFAAFRDALPRLVGKRAEGARLNEQNTVENVIQPLLDLMGWRGARAHQVRMENDVPDILLLPEARGEWTEDDALAAAISVLEAKKWGLPLDRREGQREAPSTQMLRYLSNASRLRGGIRWGMLVNGRHWRLYWQGARSRSEEFLELDLRRIARGECENPRHWQRVFYLMFRRLAFLPDPALDRRTFHAHAVREGRLWEARITEGLSAELLDESLPEFARAAAEKMPGQKSDPGFFERLRETVTAILFRLLFVLYAEDRGLLPTHRREYERGSLSRMRDEIARQMDEGAAFSDATGRHSAAFAELCVAIGRGDKSVHLPPYNGNLFAGDGRDGGGIHFPDSAFARLVEKLSRRVVDGKKRRINYRDLSVRHLGAIYERLLLHEFADHPEGGVQARLSPQVRKVDGSYYTPDELTELVIKRTLDPLLAEKKNAWDAAIARGASESEIRELDPAMAALNLKVCDPAMGSGHFLAALVDYIADNALEHMAEANQSERPSPLAGEVERARQRIVENARAGGFELKEDLDDRLLVRRLALKRVVYGVDKNPWAAELAKLSLWLHTFTVGAPLSFLDHHLRAGDSLFGEWIESGFRKMEEWGGALFTREFLDSAREAAGLMAAVEARPDADVEEVRGSARDYKKFTEVNRKLENMLRLIHALRWLEAEESNLPRKEREKLRNDRRAALMHLFGNGWGGPAKVLDKWALPKSKRGPSTKVMRELLAKAEELNRRERFLHWESAFPGVWPLKNGEPWEGGFDAVVGNPPWERMKMQRLEWLADRAPSLARIKPANALAQEIERRRKSGDGLIRQYDEATLSAETTMRVARDCGEYPLLSGGDTNLYSLFVERALRLVRPLGMVGVLTQSGIYSDESASRFFRKMSASGRIAAIFDFQNRRVETKNERAEREKKPNGEKFRSRFFPAVDARIKFCAFVAGGERREFPRTESAFYLNSVSEIEDEERRMEITPRDFALVNPNTGTAPACRTRRDLEITLGVYRRLPVLRRRGGNPTWPVRQCAMLHMTNDAKHFRTARELDEARYYRARGNIFQRGGDRVLPLYTGRMIHHFNHRANSVERSPGGVLYPHASRETTAVELRSTGFIPDTEYWVDESEAERRLPEGLREGGGLDWFLGFRSITNATNERCVIAALIPRAACGNNLPLLIPDAPPRPKKADDKRAAAKWRKQCAAAAAKYRAEAPFYAANLSSLALDYICRQKLQLTNLNFYMMEQLPVLPISAYSREFGESTAAEIVRDHVLRLTYAAEDMRPFARDMGFDGDPFTWDEEDRAHLRARLDALHFILYGINFEEMGHILSTFPIVHRNDRDRHGMEVTRELVTHYRNAFDADDPETRIYLRGVRWNKDGRK